jgi:hypothetical protein
LSLFRALCLALAAVVPTAAAADTITVTFTGTVDFVATQLSSGFTVGDPVSGTFQYSSTATDTLPADPVFGIYPGADNFAFDFGGYVATAAAGGSGVEVQNDMNGGAFDLYKGSKTCNGTCTAAMVDEFALAGMTFLLSGPATIFPDDSLPTSLDLTDFTQRNASLEFTNGVTGPEVTALVQSLTVTVTVPEPATLVLVLGGLGLAAWARGRSTAESR